MEAIQEKKHRKQQFPRPNLQSTQAAATLC